MKKLLLLPVALGGVLAVPLLALLALAGASNVASACEQSPSGASPSTFASALIDTSAPSGAGSGTPSAVLTASAAATPAVSASPAYLAACQQVAAPDGELAKRALAWALAHIGDAYVAAAHGPHAWDCSTFTYTAYRQAGLDWPMQISYQQYLDRRHIQLVPLSQARPGDLLFFDTGSGNSWYNPVTHVAMIIDPVAGTMVHAANPSAGVIISNYKTSSYYRTHPPASAPDARGIPRRGGGSVVGRVVG